MLKERDLLDVGFDRFTMSCDNYVFENGVIKEINPKYYYKKGRVTINATEIWTWFLDGEQRNDIAVYSKYDLVPLLKKIHPPEM